MQKQKEFGGEEEDDDMEEEGDGGAASQGGLRRRRGRGEGASSYGGQRELPEDNSSRMRYWIFGIALLIGIARAYYILGDLPEGMSLWGSSRAEAAEEDW